MKHDRAKAEKRAKSARKWRLWAIYDHMPTDLFESKSDAIYFKKAWHKPGDVVLVEVRALSRKGAKK